MDTFLGFDGEFLAFPRSIEKYWLRFPELWREADERGMEFSLIYTTESASSAFVFSHDETAWMYTVYEGAEGAWAERVSGKFVGDYSDTGWLLAQVMRWHVGCRFQAKSRSNRIRPPDEPA